MIEQTNELKFERKRKENDQGRLVPVRKTNKHIPKTKGIEVAKGSNLAPFSKVLQASNVYRTTNPQLFKLQQVNGGAIIPWTSLLPIYLSLLMVETDGAKNYILAHNKNLPGDRVKAGFLVLWDQSQTKYAQGDTGHFTDVFIKLINFYSLDICLYVVFNFYDFFFFLIIITFLVPKCFLF